MTGLIIDKLKAIDNPLAETLVKIVTNTLPSVEEGFYEGTIFESQDGYRRNSFQLVNGFQSHFGKELVETPLTFVRGREGAVWTASINQGITTGVVLFDYVTKTPLLLVVVDKDNSTYRYLSAKYNAETNTYDQLSNKTKAATKIADLTKLISDNVAKDIKTFETVNA
jgi:hypothetical protein